MKKEPLNCMSVRIPKAARTILKAEKDRIEAEEGRLVGIGTLAGVYIERGEMFEEMLDCLDHIKECLRYDTAINTQCVIKTCAKAQPLL